VGQADEPQEYEDIEAESTSTHLPKARTVCSLKFCDNKFHLQVLVPPQVRFAKPNKVTDETELLKPKPKGTAARSPSLTGK
jgi:hypothetical protein